MNCEEVQERLTDALLGEAPTSVREDLLEHAATCAACAGDRGGAAARRSSCCGRRRGRPRPCSARRSASGCSSARRRGVGPSGGSRSRRRSRPPRWWPRSACPRCSGRAWSRRRPCPRSRRRSRGPLDPVPVPRAVPSRSEGGAERDPAARSRPAPAPRRHRPSPPESFAPLPNGPGVDGMASRGSRYRTRRTSAERVATALRRRGPASRPCCSVPRRRCRGGSPPAWTISSRPCPRRRPRCSSSTAARTRGSRPSGITCRRFGLDVDTASYTLTRNYIRRGQLPPPEAVRVEEFVNALPSDEPDPGGATFGITTETMASPFDEGRTFLRVGIRAKDVARRDRKPARLVFLVDVSGSMRMENRLELVKRSLRLLVDRLDERDSIGIVAYGTLRPRGRCPRRRRSERETHPGGRRAPAARGLDQPGGGAADRLCDGVRSVRQPRRQPRRALHRRRRQQRRDRPAGAAAGRSSTAPPRAST